MVTDINPFSRRNNYKAVANEIFVREEAPSQLREALVVLGENMGLSPSQMRLRVCGVLLKTPDRGNWTEYPNIYAEVVDLVRSCEWYKVYDIAESFYEQIHQYDVDKSKLFQDQLNGFMEEHGIGYSMQEGQIVVRGSETFDVVQKNVVTDLRKVGKKTAANEMHEALSDLARRPRPDISGSIQHAMAALECLLRDITGEPNKTLGDLMKIVKDQNLIPKPLDVALEKIWGYSSEMGRHLREGKEPRFEEAQLIVTISAAVCAYLTGSVLLREILS